MKTIYTCILAVALIFGATASVAHAATPSLALASGTTFVQISVNGDPNQTVALYYYTPGTSTINSVGTIGSTNNTGYFSTTVNNGSYNIPSGANIYVVVNAQQSTNAMWPSFSGGNIYLSQSSIVMNQGQNSSISISGGTGSNYYVSSNSNASVVGASVSGSILSLNALSNGYATINVCSLSSTTSCAAISVTVNSAWMGNNGAIYLSPGSVTIAPGQSQTVNISNNFASYNQYGNAQYNIANNPGSQYFSATISGNTVIVYGSNPGSATVNICSQYITGTPCASLYVTVTGGYNYGNNGNYYNGTNYNNYNGYNGYNNYNGYYGNGGFTYTNPTYTYTNPVTYTYPSTTYTSSAGSSYNSGSRVGNSVSGVFLSQVPSTGISYGLKMTLFILGLLLWSMFGAFMIARKKGVTSVSTLSAQSSVHKSVKVSNAKPANKIEAFKLSNMKKKGIM
jgi:hypothetical protein